MSDVIVIKVLSSGPPGVGLPAGSADAGKLVAKDGTTPYLYKLVDPGAANLPQGLSTTDTPTFNGAVFTSSITIPTAPPTSNATIAASTAWVRSYISSLGYGTGTVTSVTGTPPLQVATGTTTPVISISAATPSTAGSMSATDKTKLDSITVDSATLVRKFVRNNSGVDIPKGAAVYQTGSSGTTLTVALADASTEATAAQTLGLAQETIPDNSTGYIVAVGLLDGINTSTLAEGQIVWLSETPGQLTTTRPTQPAHGVVCGYCVKQGPGTSGILYVKIDNGLELAELHDVLITAPVTNQALFRAANGLWINRFATAADISDFTTAVASLFTTVGNALRTLASPSAISFLRINADNTVTARSGADMRSDLGLGTAALADASSFASASSLATKADLVGGVVPTSQIPAIAISDFLGSVNSQAAMLALSGQRGDWAIRNDRSRTWILIGDDASQLANWAELPVPTDAVTSVNGQLGAVTLGPSDVGAATAAQGSKADSAIQPGDPALSDAREWSAPTVTQADAEAGVATTRVAWTAQRVRQAVAAWWQATSSTVGRALATAVDQAAGRAALGLGSASTGALATTAPLNPAATAAAGTSGDVARADHVHQFQPSDPIIPLSHPTNALVVGVCDTIGYWPRATVLTAIPIWMVGTAPTGAALQFDIRIGGTSIFSTLPTIAAGGTNSTTTTAAVFSTAFVSGGQAIAAGSSVTFHVLQIGSTVAGAGLKVALPTRRGS